MFKIVIEHRTKDKENSKILIKDIKSVRHIAAKQPGFVSSEVFINAMDPCHVIIISTWKTAEDWKAWDESKERAETRPAIERLLAVPFNAILLSDKIAWREDQVNIF
jgi:heme-degrading monooxygenase HmoA